MGENQPVQALAPILDEAGVGHDHVDPRHAVVAEGDTQVDHHPTVAAGRSETVKVKVHAELPGAAQRDEKQFFLAHFANGR